MEIYQHKLVESLWIKWIDKNFVIIFGQVAGVTLLFAGATATALFVWVGYAIASRGVIDAVGFAFLCVFAAVGCFGIVVGYRLLFLKPNRSGSILGTFGWSGLGLFWAAICVLMVWLGVAMANLSNYPLAIAALAVCAWCFYKAKVCANSTG